jgi:hypothetical protein
VTAPGVTYYSSRYYGLAPSTPEVAPPAINYSSLNAAAYGYAPGYSPYVTSYSYVPYATTYYARPGQWRRWWRQGYIW